MNPGGPRKHSVSQAGCYREVHAWRHCRGTVGKKKIIRKRRSDFSAAKMPLRIQWVNNYELWRENYQHSTKLIFRKTSKVKYLQI